MQNKPFERIGELIEQSKSLLEDGAIIEIVHYYEHGEYEMAFEGLLIELIKAHKYPEQFNFTEWKSIVKCCNIHQDFVFDSEIWSKFLKWGCSKQPTNDDLICRLKDVLKGELSREEFNAWTYKWIENFENRNQLNHVEEIVHSNLIFLLGIDLEVEKDVYLHSNSDIEKWIEQLEDGKLLN